MASVKAAAPKTAPAFPAGEIETCIRDFLAEEAEMQATLHGGSMSGPSGGSIGPQPVIDSLVVVEILLEIEPMVPFELPDSLVRPGGYNSITGVVQHLIPQLETQWRKYHDEEKS